MRQINTIFEFISTKYYGRKVPSKYWLVGSMSLLLLILLSTYNAYNLGLVAALLLNIKTVFLQSILTILFFVFFIISLSGILTSAEKKIKFSDLSFIVPIYLLIILSTYFQYIVLVTDNKNITFQVFLSVIESNSISKNITFFILLMIQLLFYYLLIAHKKQVINLLNKEIELQKSTRHLDIMIEKRKQDERESFKQLYLERIKSTESQLEVVEFIQHELGNKLPTAYSDILRLQKYINKNYPKLYEEKVRNAVGDENPETIESFADLMNRTIYQIGYSIRGVKEMGKIIKCAPSKMNLIETKLIDFLKKIFTSSINSEKPPVDFYIEGDADINVHVDQYQFELLLNNFFENAYRHGFTDEKKYFIKIIVTKKENNVVIDIINNGNDFPSGFSLINFVKPGKHLGKTGNTGSGGHLIDIVIKNHGGTLSIIDNSHINPEYKVTFQIVLPIKQINHE